VLGALLTYGNLMLRSANSPALMVFASPLVFLAAAFAITLAVAAAKWILIGKYRPRIEPLWAPFVRHSELITGMYESAAVPSLVGMASGTPFAGPLLRLFGVKVGKRVYLDMDPSKPGSSSRKVTIEPGSASEPR
jgi:hypothetical protein